MSQQIQITGGAKVRDLQDVIIGTSGVLSSLAFDVANGVPKLDSNGKILVSQLPNSVMEYKGTWNAATNTPTLANGTGNQGDVYLCNVAGTVDFGAGPIAFVVGDQVIYSGSIWQRASGATGTVTSVAITESGDSLNITGSPITTSGTINIGFNGTNLQYVNGAGNLTTFPTLITSIGLSMPSAFSVANSPLTANGTIAVTGAGVASQYIRGDGTLADFPTSGGGGSSVSYYLNGGTSQGTIGGTTYYEMSKTAVIGTGVDFTKTGDGFIVAFLTDANDPAQLNIPAGNWNYEIYASMSSNGGTPEMYAELYVYDGTTFTLISTSPHEILYDGTALNLYTFAMAVPATTLTLTDRLAVKIYATNSGGKTTTIHTQDGHLCQIITTFSTGITALNGLTAQVQYFQVGTSGTDFNISSTTATHTFNIPDASATARGLITTGTQTIAGTKTFSDATKNNGGIFLQNASSSSLAGYMNIGGLTNGVNFTSGGGVSNSFTLPSATGYTFTFPNANGTIALTTDLSGYLPLTGGTLTGSLTLPSNTASGNPALYFNYGANAASRSWRLCNDVESFGDFKIQQSTTQTGSTYADILKFTPTGGALFVASIQATLFSSIGASSGYQIYRRDTSAYAGIWYSAAGSVTLDLAGAAGTVLNFASTGVATLSNLSGSGTRMVVADSSGVLSTQAIPSAGVTGTGTTNYLPKFTGASTIGDSIISENSNEIIINVADPTLVFNGSRDYALQSNNTSGNFRIIDNTAGLERLSIASTGAATFSSSVQAATNFISNIYIDTPSVGTSAANNATYNYLGYSGYWGIRTTQTGFNFALDTYNGGTPKNVLTITQGGNVGIGTSTITTFATNYTALNINAATGYGSGTIFKINNVYECGFYSETGITTLNIAGAYAITGSFGTAFKVASGGNVLIGTTTDAGQKLQVNGTALIYDSLRLRSSSYGANYNTSIRSDASACGILQFGNNNDNYILAGNTGTGGYLIFRVNCSTESITSGSLALTLNSNATAVFASSVTATSFFESSDSRLKTLIQDNYQTKGIASITPKLYTKNGKVELGYYAQDFVGVLDSAVSKGSDDMLSLSYREVLVAKVYALEQEIKDLKAKMN